MRLATYIDSQQSKKAAKLIVSKRRPLGLLLYVIGLAYLCMLPSEDFSRKSFFDENALMAGLVKREFTDMRAISKLSDDMKRLGNNEEAILQSLENKFTEMGLEVYSQNFSAMKPVSFSSKGARVSGRNIFGILRAGRALGTESIILSTPYQTRNKVNHNGFAVMLALADYFKTKNYWAKDLIFLITHGNEVGMQSWIDGYMGLSSKDITSSPLPSRSGAIQAVINLEVPSGSIQYAEIISEGVNGILPNLDLVNVVVYLCQTERVETAFHVQQHTSLNQHYHSLQTMLAIAFHQSLGLPIANHALFLKHRIDSVTIRTVPKPDSGHVSNDLLKLARALEGTFRSVNNLLETLHHSEFFYFTLSSHHFISIGLYMPPFAFLIAPIVLEALAQWLLARNPELSLKPNTNKPTNVSLPFPFQAVMKLLLMSFTSGLFLCSVPTVASLFQHPLRVDGLVFSLLLACGVSLLVPLLLRSRIGSNEWKMSKAIGLILLMLAMVAVAMMNYSLAVYLALVLPVPAVLAQPYTPENKKAHVLRIIVSLLLTPPLCLVYFCSLYVYLFNFEHNQSIPEIFTGGLHLTLEGIAAAYNAWHFVGSWIYFVVCAVVWPFWLMGWTLCCHRQLELNDRTSHHEKEHTD